MTLRMNQRRFMHLAMVSARAQFGPRQAVTEMLLMLIMCLLGPRQCIGHKFATTEAVCFLTMLLKDYKVKPVMKKGETKEQWKKRVLSAKLGLTLGVEDVPVEFVRRKNI